jgi:hypothetical protein
MPDEKIDPTIKRVARALCHASGENPDSSYQTGELIVVEKANMVTHDYEQAPRWKKYVPEAQRFAAAFNAMQNTE